MIKLTREDRENICKALLDNVSVSELARYYGLTLQEVSSLKTRLDTLTNTAKVSVSFNKFEYKYNKWRTPNSNYLTKSDLIHLIKEHMELN